MTSLAGYLLSCQHIIVCQLIIVYQKDKKICKHKYSLANILSFTKKTKICTNTKQVLVILLCTLLPTFYCISKRQIYTQTQRQKDKSSWLCALLPTFIVYQAVQIQLCGHWMQKESDADRRCPLKDYIISCKKLTCTEVSVKGKDKDSMQKILVCT